MRHRVINNVDVRQSRSVIYKLDGSVASTTLSSASFENKQDMFDDVHKRPKKHRILSPLDLGDWGGDMTLVSVKGILPGDISREIPQSGPTGRRTYDGFWWPSTNLGLTNLVLPSEASLTAWGTRGVALAAPTRPHAGLAQFVAELKELPKKPIVGLYRYLKGSRGSGARFRHLFRGSAHHIGGEYLNFEFGWRPLIQDLLDFHESTKNAERIINQFIRDSGRVVRRRRMLRDDRTTEETVGPLNSAGYGPSSSFHTPVSKLVTKRFRQNQIWFSGAFTYYIHPGNDYVSNWRRNEQILNHLYGTRFDIALLWELMPWSWAIDWVSSIGSIAQNLSAFSNDGLVMKYGYVMFRSVITTEQTVRARLVSDGSIATCSSTVVQELKMRRRASPFGFGLTVGSFSPRQLAILSALALTRVA